MLRSGRPFGQSLIDPISILAATASLFFLQHHHMTVAVNTFLAKIDPGGVDAGLLQPTFPRWPVLGRLRHNTGRGWLGD